MTQILSQLLPFLLGYLAYLGFRARYHWGIEHGLGGHMAARASWYPCYYRSGGRNSCLLQFDQLLGCEYLALSVSYWLATSYGTVRLRPACCGLFFLSCYGFLPVWSGLQAGNFGG